MRRDNELRDLHAARDREGRFSVIDQDRRDLAAIIGIDRARRVQHVTPCFSARPERGRTCASTPCGNASAMPVGTA